MSETFEKGLLAILLTGVTGVASAFAQSAQPPQSTQPAKEAVSPFPKVAGESVSSQRAIEYYRRRWGIEDIVVREVASGALIRFSYRVVDPDKAKILNDKKAHPSLIDEKHSLALQVPEMDNVGRLRQVATPQSDREYWMAFSNKGHQVKAGDRVTVIIGAFRAEGLTVTSQLAANPPGAKP